MSDEPVRSSCAYCAYPPYILKKPPFPGEGRGGFFIKKLKVEEDVSIINILNSIKWFFSIARKKRDHKKRI
jgi:hypothetical protein